MEQAAIRHRGDKEYCYAVGKDRFLIRLQVKKNDCSEVILHYTDKYLYAKGRAEVWQAPMKKVATDQCHDYYEVEIQIHMICLRYFFELVGNEMAGDSLQAAESVPAAESLPAAESMPTAEILYYGNDSIFREKITSLAYMYDCPQQMREEERFLVPDWAKGKVSYQIFVDSFAATDEETENQDWYHTPMDRYGVRLHGSLKGIIRKLDYMKDLGVDILYLTPIFKAGSNHKYDTIDYRQIDPEFGSREDLEELVRLAHEKNMYVVLDGVFNHTSTQFFAFQDLREKGEYSAYVDWYYPESLPIDCGSRERKPNYLSFGYFGGMPKLNCQNKEVQQYVIETVTYWMETCHVDGWRLDVGDEVSHVFWKKFRQAVKAVKEDALIVGEVWYYAPGFLQGDEWDGMMNYNFKNAVMEFAAKETMVATEFVSRLEFLRGNVHLQAYGALWNLIDSHDTPRFLHEAGEEKGRLKVAAALQLLHPGTPMLYYGDELGMTGGQDPDCRRGMLWRQDLQDQEMLSYYQRLIQIRRMYKSITDGEAKYIRVSDEDKLVVVQHILETNESCDNAQDNSGSKQAVIIAFHAGAGSVSLPEGMGKTDKITNTQLEGQIGAYGVVVFEA